MFEKPLDFVSEFSFPDLDLDGNSNHESSEKEDHKGDKKRRNSNHKVTIDINK